jgi:hypothetical protein
MKVFPSGLAEDSIFTGYLYVGLEWVEWRRWLRQLWRFDPALWVKFFLHVSTSDDKVTMLSRNIVTDYLLMRRYILEGKNSKMQISLHSDIFYETFSGMVIIF